MFGQKLFDYTCYNESKMFSPSSEFSVSSFCRVINMANYSNLRVLRLEANKINSHDVPPEALLCLRKATSINL